MKSQKTSSVTNKNQLLVLPKSPRTLTKSKTSKSVTTLLARSMQTTVLAVSAFTLLFALIGAYVAVFNSPNKESAKAQSAPTDPTVPTVPLPPNTTSNPSARITAITRTNQGISVEFTTTNFINSAQGNRTNFYFDTEANTVTNKSFVNQSPYTLNTQDIPSNATELCVIVANSSNTPINNSGNCFVIPSSTTNTTTGGTNPQIEVPTTPTPTSEVINVRGGDETITTTDTPTQPTTPQNPTNINQQAVSAGQQSGTTARTGGLAFVTGLVLLAVVIAFAYYKIQGDKKSTLKMVEKRINIKK